MRPPLVKVKIKGKCSPENCQHKTTPQKKQKIEWGASDKTPEITKTALSLSPLQNPRSAQARPKQVNVADKWQQMYRNKLRLSLLRRIQKRTDEAQTGNCDILMTKDLHWANSAPSSTSMKRAVQTGMGRKKTYTRFPPTIVMASLLHTTENAKQWRYNMS